MYLIQSFYISKLHQNNIFFVKHNDRLFSDKHPKTIEEYHIIFLFSIRQNFKNRFQGGNNFILDDVIYKYFGLETCLSKNSTQQ